MFRGAAHPRINRCGVLIMAEEIVRHIHENKDERKDSVTIGTPSKGGEVKIYFSAARPEEINALIDNAFAARKYAQGKMEAP
jgi:hypothetical protein